MPYYCPTGLIRALETYQQGIKALISNPEEKKDPKDQVRPQLEKHNVLIKNIIYHLGKISGQEDPTKNLLTAAYDFLPIKSILAKVLFVKIEHLLYDVFNENFNPFYQIFSVNKKLLDLFELQKKFFQSLLDLSEVQLLNELNPKKDGDSKEKAGDSKESESDSTKKELENLLIEIAKISDPSYELRTYQHGEIFCLGETEENILNLAKKMANKLILDKIVPEEKALEKVAKILIENITGDEREKSALYSKLITLFSYKSIASKDIIAPIPSFLQPYIKDNLSKIPDRVQYHQYKKLCLLHSDSLFPDPYPADTLFLRLNPKKDKIHIYYKDDREHYHFCWTHSLIDLIDKLPKPGETSEDLSLLHSILQRFHLKDVSLNCLIESTIDEYFHEDKEYIKVKTKYKSEIENIKLDLDFKPSYQKIKLFEQDPKASELDTDTIAIIIKNGKLMACAWVDNGRIRKRDVKQEEQAEARIKVLTKILTLPDFSNYLQYLIPIIIEKFNCDPVVGRILYLKPNDLDDLKFFESLLSKYLSDEIFNAYNKKIDEILNKLNIRDQTQRDAFHYKYNPLMKYKKLNDFIVHQKRRLEVSKQDKKEDSKSVPPPFNQVMIASEDFNLEKIPYGTIVLIRKPGTKGERDNHFIVHSRSMDEDKTSQQRLPLSPIDLTDLKFQNVGDISADADLVKKIQLKCIIANDNEISFILAVLTYLMNHPLYIRNVEQNIHIFLKCKIQQSTDLLHHALNQEVIDQSYLEESYVNALKSLKSANQHMGRLNHCNRTLFQILNELGISNPTEQEYFANVFYKLQYKYNPFEYKETLGILIENARKNHPNCVMIDILNDDRYPAAIEAIKQQAKTMDSTLEALITEINALIKHFESATMSIHKKKAIPEVYKEALKFLQDEKISATLQQGEDNLIQILNDLKITDPETQADYIKLGNQKYQAYEPQNDDNPYALFALYTSKHLLQHYIDAAKIYISHSENIQPSSPSEPIAETKHDEALAFDDAHYQQWEDDLKEIEQNLQNNSEPSHFHELKEQAMQDDQNREKYIQSKTRYRARHNLLVKQLKQEPSKDSNKMLEKIRIKHQLLMQTDERVHQRLKDKLRLIQDRLMPYKEQEELKRLATEIKKYIKALQDDPTEEKNESLKEKFDLSKIFPYAVNLEKREKVQKLIEEAELIRSKKAELIQLENNLDCFLKNQTDLSSDRLITVLNIFFQRKLDTISFSVNPVIHSRIQSTINQARERERERENDNKVRTLESDLNKYFDNLPPTVSNLIIWKTNHPDRNVDEKLKQFQESCEALTRTKNISDRIKLFERTHLTTCAIITAIETQSADKESLKKLSPLWQNEQITADLVLAMLYHIGKIDESEITSVTLKSKYDAKHEKFEKMDLKAKKILAIDVIKHFIPQMEMSELLDLGVRLKNEARFIRKERGYWRHNLGDQYGNTQSYHEIMTFIQHEITHRNTYEEKGGPRDAKNNPTGKKAVLIPKENYDNYRTIMDPRTSHCFSSDAFLGLFRRRRIPNDAKGEPIEDYPYKSSFCY